MSINTIKENYTQKTGVYHIGPIEDAKILSLGLLHIKSPLTTPSVKLTEDEISFKNHSEKAEQYNQLLEAFNSSNKINSNEEDSAFCYEADKMCEEFFGTEADENTFFDAHPNILHLIKDTNGKSIVEQFRHYITKKANKEKDLALLFHIKISLASGKTKEASELFNNLTGKTKHIIISQLKKSNPSLAQHEIEKLIAQNPTLLIKTFDKQSSIEKALKQITQQRSKPFTFSGAYRLIDPLYMGTCQANVSDIQKINQLQEFYYQLKKMQIGFNKQLTDVKYQKLDRELKSADKATDFL